MIPSGAYNPMLDVFLCIGYMILNQVERRFFGWWKYSKFGAFWVFSCR